MGANNVARSVAPQTPQSCRPCVKEMRRKSKTIPGIQLPNTVPLRKFWCFFITYFNPLYSLSCTNPLFWAQAYWNVSHQPVLQSLLMFYFHPCSNWFSNKKYWNEHLSKTENRKEPVVSHNRLSMIIKIWQIRSPIFYGSRIGSINKNWIKQSFLHLMYKSILAGVH